MTPGGGAAGRGMWQAGDQVHLVQIRPAMSRGETPMVLSDRAGRRVRYLRVSLTDRCNYRCTYCMPDRPLDYGPRSALLSLEEVGDIVAEFARAGVERVRLTGGEPTLRRGVIDLVTRLSELRVGRSETRLLVTMTTNGERLAEVAADLARAGLSGITISIDTLDPIRFSRITRRGKLDRVLEGIAAARATGLSPIKLNTVAIRGFNDDELGTIARFAWEHDITPRFIELMPMASGELFAPGDLMSARDVRAQIVADLAGQPGADGRGALAPDDGRGVAGSGPATYWRVTEGRHRGYRLGTIAAMTENFCGSCNRLRLSATGQLHACLARDETGDLRAAVRSADPGALPSVVAQVLGTKRDGHGFNMDGSGGPAKAMVSIGG